MTRIVAAALLGVSLSAAACPSEGNMAGPDRPAPPAAPARDGNIAIAQELDAARKAGTIAAYDLFIARHPGHPLEAVARRERAALIASGARR